MVKQRLGRLLAVTAAVTAISGTAAASAVAGPVLEVDGPATPGYLWIVNTGDEPAPITDVQITAGDIWWIGRDSDECSGTTLGPGTDGCWIRVDGTYGSLEFSISGYPSQTINLR